VSLPLTCGQEKRILRQQSMVLTEANVTRLLILGATSVALIATAAMAQTSGDVRGPSNDPGQIVCIKEKEIGSRVATRRVCRTRAEWEQHRSQTRQVLERVQNNKATVGG
jgi:hypothetical protein